MSNYNSETSNTTTIAISDAKRKYEATCEAKEQAKKDKIQQAIDSIMYKVAKMLSRKGYAIVSLRELKKLNKDFDMPSVETYDEREKENKNISSYYAYKEVAKQLLDEFTSNNLVVRYFWKRKYDRKRNYELHHAVGFRLSFKDEN